MISIREVHNEKKRFLELLLLADEEESMIDRYLERGRLFIMEEGSHTLACCLVTEEDDETAEIKNLAVSPEFQGKGYGRQMLDFVALYYQKTHSILLAGTGESAKTLGFYERCGFVYSYRVPNFFTDNYHYPIIEDGKQLVDMIYLSKKLS